MLLLLCALLALALAGAGGRGERPLGSLALLPNDPLLADRTALLALDMLRLPEAWELSTGGQGALLAVIDSGVNEVPDLAGAIRERRSLTTPDPADTVGHGTAMAGLAAARAGNQQGAAGVCWSCSLLSLKTAFPEDETKVSLRAAAQALDQAVAAGARVVNLSFGGSHLPELEQAVARALAADVLLVASAGNLGSSEPSYPAAYPGVLSVAALDASGRRASFSNYGPWVRLAAPACGLTTRHDGSYGYVCGTSASAALVSGLAALVRGARPELSAAQVAAALEESARPLAEQGVAARGLVDARAALERVGLAPPAPSPPSPPTRPQGSGSAQPDTQPLRVLARPRILGVARVGSRLLLAPGRYAPGVSRLQAAWQRCPRSTLSGCRTVARGRVSYTVRQADAGQRLRVLVRVVGPAGQTLELSTQPRLVPGSARARR